MKLLEITEYLVKSVIKFPEELELNVEETDNEIVIEVLVSEKDMGRVIGRGGNTANSIRTLVQASSYLQDNKRVRINIDAK